MNQPDDRHPSLAGKTALITGASRGIGAETVAARIRAAGGQAVTVRADLTDASAVAAMADARVVFVTSHQAHFVGSRPTLPAYQPVARSKRAGEDALRERIGALAARGIGLVVVSGDMIEGTITATLLDRGTPGAIETRRTQAGDLPTVPQFAAAVAGAAVADVATGHTIYIGGADYLS